MARATGLEVARATGLSESGAAAIVSVGVDPGIGVGHLTEVAGVTQPVARWLVGDLAAPGLVGKQRRGREVAPTLTAAGGILAAPTASVGKADHICRLCDEEACGLDDCPVERMARRIGS